MYDDRGGALGLSVGMYEQSCSRVFLAEAIQSLVNVVAVGSAEDGTARWMRVNIDSRVTLSELFMKLSNSFLFPSSSDGSHCSWIRGQPC